ncbi:hypothetical protein DAPPUDRAFT_258133 [Daphnia pulex]|uniref:Uncharacterized protein n=1 Tax=Daphnia pulex TaxID=6669 RepID=E9HET5_DAPPU|nr:hypothetical protein DAPPUDRAFT_258133 [Daphnia pulex]|eukprot:EFX69727.1 hypothetical protein DAPPUDRAFT_258133 [Daphnia pulex]
MEKEITMLKEELKKVKTKKDEIEKALKKDQQIVAVIVLRALNQLTENEDLRNQLESAADYM